ncbi:hypothetical protein E4U55_008015 [Claviceps digitariae]|nr:hypothetical protein E4U55_008015 [Claviceps digitariae]
MKNISSPELIPSSLIDEMGCQTNTRKWQFEPSDDEARALTAHSAAARVNSLAAAFPSRDDAMHQNGSYCSPHQLDMHESLDTSQMGFPGLLLTAPLSPQVSVPVELNNFTFEAIETDSLSTFNSDTAAFRSPEPSNRIGVGPDIETLVSPVPLTGVAPICGLTSSGHWNSQSPHPQRTCAQPFSSWGPSVQENDTPPQFVQLTPSAMVSATPTGTHSLAANIIPDFYGLCNTWSSSLDGGDHSNALYRPMGVFPPVAFEGGYTCPSDIYHSQTDARYSNATSQLLQRTQSVMSEKDKARPRRCRRTSRSSAITSPGPSVIPQAQSSTAESGENPIRRSGRHGPLSRETNANAQQNRMGYLTCYNCKARKVTYLINCLAVPQWFKPFILTDVDPTPNLCLMEAYMRDCNIRIQRVDDSGEFSLRLSAIHKLWQKDIFKQSATCSMQQFVTGLSTYYDVKCSDYLDMRQCDWDKPMEVFLQLDAMSSGVNCYLTWKSGCYQLDEPTGGVLQDFQQRLCFISMATFQHLRHRLEMLACSHLERDLTSRTTAQGNNAIKPDIETLNLLGRYLLTLRRRICIWKKQQDNLPFAAAGPHMNQGVLRQASAQMDSLCYDLYSHFCFHSQSMDISLRNRIEMARATSHPDTGPRREYLPTIKGEAGFAAWMRDGEAITASVGKL